MKHNPRILIWLLGLFLVAQYVGLFVVNAYIDYPTSLETGNFTVTDLPAIAGQAVERPVVEERYSPIFLVGAIVLGTVLLLLIIRWGKTMIWKVWFFLAVAFSLHFSAFAFFKDFLYGAWISLGLAVVFAFWKIWRPSIIIQNLTEVFLYGGLAAIFFSVVNVKAMIIILILVSFYDMYAVWKSKHMIKLAKFQTKSGIFAGLLLPYRMPKHVRKVKISKSKKVKAVKGVRMAVLGGGDIGFPLLFAASVLKEYALIGQGWLALLIPPFAGIALIMLLTLGKQNRFYPAMPFITIGCFVGLGLVWILRVTLLA